MDELLSNPLYSFLFVGAGLALLLLEVFIPSAGVLGILAVCAIGFGAYGFFVQERYVLAIGTIAGSIGFGVWILRLAVRRVRLEGGFDVELLDSTDPRNAGLLGKRGIASSSLRPSGVAIIEGQRIDVVAGRFIERGQEIEVIDTSGNRVVVQEIAGATAESRAEEDT